MPPPALRCVQSPAPREVWDGLVRADPLAMISQQPAWTDALAATPGFQDASRLYETADGRLLLLPLVTARAALPGLAAAASMPDGWEYGGPLSSQPMRRADADALLADLSALPGLRAALRPNPLAAPLWDGAARAGFAVLRRQCHILSLAGGFGEVWSKRFSTATRTKIRKAEKNGIEIQSASGGALLDVFYEVYGAWVDRRARERSLPRPLARALALRREPRAKFQAAARALGPAFQVWVARVDGVPAAAAILLLGAKQAVYWRSASVKELAGPSRANDLLQKCLIEAACASGCAWYFMGESGGVESLMHFKERFGAAAYAAPAFYHERLPLTPARLLVERLIRQVERRVLREDHG